MSVPSNAYATVADFKASRRIKSDDTVDDDALTDVLIAASRQLDQVCGQPPNGFKLDQEVSTRTYSVRGRTYYDSDGEWLLIDAVGSVVGLVVEVGSGSSWTTVTDYEVGPENALARQEPITKLLKPMSYWTTGGGVRVRVTARFGYPVVPDEIKRATMILANRLYLRKDSPQGVIGSSEWGAIRISRVDPDVEALISPFMSPGFA